MFKQRIFGLDVMRAAAILLVIFSHTLWIVPNAEGLVLDLLSLSGFLGVEIFFVLSGFLIGKIIYKLFVNDEFDFSKVKYFWVRRWFRTLPNYYLVLLLNIGVATYLGTNLPDNLWQYFLFFQNFSSGMPLFFTESWSLPIEEFAYIVGPLLLFGTLFLKLKVRKPVLFALITISVIIVSIVTKIIYNTNVENNSLIYWNVNLKATTIYRLDAIYYGVFAAFLALVKPKSWTKFSGVWFVIGAIIFLGLNVLITRQQIFIETHPFFWNVLYLPINSIAIACCLPLLSNIKTAPKFILIPITHISLISYSMYLLHYSIILQLLKYFIPSEGLSNFNLSIYISIYIIVTILCSSIFYHFFEKPMTDLRDKPFVLKKFNQL